VQPGPRNECPAHRFRGVGRPVGRANLLILLRNIASRPTGPRNTGGRKNISIHLAPIEALTIRIDIVSMKRFRWAGGPASDLSPSGKLLGRLLPGPRPGPRPKTRGPAGPGRGPGCFRCTLGKRSWPGRPLGERFTAQPTLTILDICSVLT